MNRRTVLLISALLVMSQSNVYSKEISLGLNKMNENEKIEYFVAETEEEGKPITFRWAKVPADKAKTFPHLVSIFWPYTPEVNGLPSEEINKSQNLFEDAIDELETQNLGVLSLVVFGNGQKEWRWYAGDLEQWYAALNKALEKHEQYPLTIQHTEDDNWAYHKEFLAWIE